VLVDFWHGTTESSQLSVRRLTEYGLIGLYGSLGIFAAIISRVAKAGSLFGPVIVAAPIARPEISSLLKHVALASIDFSASGSLLILGVMIVYFGRRRRAALGEPINAIVAADPPSWL